MSQNPFGASFQSPGPNSNPQVSEGTSTPSHSESPSDVEKQCSRSFPWLDMPFQRLQLTLQDPRYSHSSWLPAPHLVYKLVKSGPQDRLWQESPLQQSLLYTCAIHPRACWGASLRCLGTSRCQFLTAFLVDCIIVHSRSCSHKVSHCRRITWPISLTPSLTLWPA